MSKFARKFAGIAVAASLIGGIAQAHALLVSTKVEGQDVVLRYNGRVDAARSRLTIINKTDGSEIEKVECEAGEDQATLKGHLGTLAPGSYVLRWEVLSVDGHISRGDQPLVLPAP
jgi:methionine-rich copper-binding protein CopC